MDKKIDIIIASIIAISFLGLQIFSSLGCNETIFTSHSPIVTISQYQKCDYLCITRDVLNMPDDSGQNYTPPGNPTIVKVVGTAPSNSIFVYDNTAASDIVMVSPSPSA